MNCLESLANALTDDRKTESLPPSNSIKNRLNVTKKSFLIRLGTVHFVARRKVQAHCNELLGSSVENC